MCQNVMIYSHIYILTILSLNKINSKFEIQNSKFHIIYSHSMVAGGLEEMS